MSTRKRKELLDAVSQEVRRFIAGVILFNLQVAEEVGINATDLQCLHVLQLQESATPGELARWSRLTTGGITVVLDRLERAGYIKRGPNPKDRRSVIIRPVLPALRKMETIYQSKSELLMGVLNSYEEGQLKLLLDFFHKTNSGAEGPV